MRLRCGTTYTYKHRIVSVAVDFTRSVVTETIAVVLLEIRRNRVCVRMPPCETWPEGHDTWLDREALTPHDTNVIPTNQRDLPTNTAESALATSPGMTRMS